MNRGERRARTNKTLKKRLKTAGGLIFGIDKKKKAQPHRMAKHKPKFTHDRSSMKFEKQKANRAARRKVHQAVKAEKELTPEKTASIRWDYW